MTEDWNHWFQCFNKQYQRTIPGLQWTSCDGADFLADVCRCSVLHLCGCTSSQLPGSRMDTKKYSEGIPQIAADWCPISYYIPIIVRHYDSRKSCSFIKEIPLAMSFNGNSIDLWHRLRRTTSQLGWQGRKHGHGRPWHAGHGMNLHHAATAISSLSWSNSGL